MKRRECQKLASDWWTSVKQHMFSSSLHQKDVLNITGKIPMKWQANWPQVISQTALPLGQLEASVRGHTELPCCTSLPPSKFATNNL